MKLLSLLLLPTLALAQTVMSPDRHPAVDHIGMTLDEFKQAHHDLGVYVLDSHGKKVWRSTLLCHEFGMLTDCDYITKIWTGLPASSEDIFVDGKLAEIRFLIGTAADGLRQVLDGLSARYRLSGSSQESRQPLQPAQFFEDDNLIIELEPRQCGLWSRGYPASVGIELDTQYLLQRRYCAQGQSVDFGSATILIADKKLAGTMAKATVSGGLN